MEIGRGCGLYVAWKEHEFMFDNESLEEITNTLSLWYNVMYSSRLQV